jgi:photosystem II stability/assembly factor-like uncharacterized protein
MKEYLVFILTFLLFSTLCYPQWVKVDSGLPGWESQGFAIDALNGSFALISVGLPPPASTLYKTIDGGISWNPLIVPNSSELTDVAIVDENRIFVCNISGPPLIIGTSDGGDNWENLFDASSVSIFLDYIEFFGENNGMVMGDAVNENSPAAFIQTSDGGQNWNPVNNSLLGGFSGNMWTRIDFVNQDIGYFFDSQTQKLLKTINGGSDWAELTSFPSVTPMVIKFYDQNIGLALQTYVGVFRTFNGGTTWDTTSINTNSYGSDIEFLPNDPSKIWIATLDELFFSSDAGATWQMDPISGSFEDGRDLEIADGVGWFLCETVYRKVDINRVSDLNDGNNFLPETFKLYQNYPNPFNPTTTIKFEIPERSFVTIKVYDVLGGEVATIINEEKLSGNYEVEFDGSQLNSGIYFYQIKAGNFVETKKMILLK